MRAGTKTAQCLRPPSFVHVILLIPVKANQPDDEAPMFPYIIAFYSLSTVLQKPLHTVKTESGMHSTLLYYDACVMQIMSTQ